MNYRLLRNDRPFRNSKDIRKFIESNLSKGIVYYDRGTLPDIVMKLFGLKKEHTTLRITGVIFCCREYIRCSCYDILNSINTTFELTTWSISTGRAVFLTDKKNNNSEIEKISNWKGKIV